jgi:hypothetical protein
MTGNEIRKAFLDYFAERGHAVVPSGSLVPQGDATLMFANAGMVPFKRVFTGEERRAYTRAASSQKCMRVSGKHNDLEEVGRSPSHQTFFEMLGNFSFGDYFKKDAIDFAWDLLTRVFGLDPNDLVVSVLDGDDEAWALWRDGIGLDERRIFRLSEEENFWQMGDTGPCGPCSEIHKITDRKIFEKGGDPSGPGFIEIWNLVFMQYEQSADQQARRCPALDRHQHGLDASRALQGVETTTIWICYGADRAPRRSPAANAAVGRGGATCRARDRGYARACAFSSVTRAAVGRGGAAMLGACCGARRATACCSGSSGRSCSRSRTR